MLQNQLLWARRACLPVFCSAKPNTDSASRFSARNLARRCLPGLLATGLLSFPHHHARAQSSGVREAWLRETGTASFYGRDWQGRRTASGAVFNCNAMTAAHPWLPFGTRVRVTVRATGRSVVVIITDRPGTDRRVIDLSLGAARLLGIVQQGVAFVSLDQA